MRWTNVTILSILTILMALTTTGTATPDTLPHDSTNAALPLADQAAAIARALAYTGFDQSSSFSRESANMSASMVTFGDSMVPYEYDWETGRDAWLVTFSSVMLDFPDAKLRSAEYARDFEVIVDAETGQLLRITSPCKDKRISEFLAEVPESAVYPDIGVKVSLPLGPPKTSLNEILRRNPQVRGLECTSSAAEAKQIVAYYLNYAWNGHGTRITLVEGEPRDCWMVILKDTNLDPSSADGEASAIRVFGQSFFDAISGEVVPTPYMLIRYPDNHIDRSAPR